MIPLFSELQFKNLFIYVIKFNYFHRIKINYFHRGLFRSLDMVLFALEPKEQLLKQLPDCCQKMYGLKQSEPT